MNKDGKLSYNEFLSGSACRKMLHDRYIETAFKHFDLNGDGKLDFKEVEEVLCLR